MTMRPSRETFERLVGFDRDRMGSRIGPLAGVDEAGRGALAGPVVAAAVVCEPCEELLRVRDSKLLPESARERLRDIIVERCAAWSAGVVEPGVIDRINILKATMEAMKIAVEGLEVRPSLVIVDGRDLPDIPFPAEAVTGGDNRSFSVAAASIVAKVTRDRIMREQEKLYPGYGFLRNKGYGTREHILAIRERGSTIIHRRSFRIGSDG